MSRSTLPLGLALCLIAAAGAAAQAPSETFEEIIEVNVEGPGLKQVVSAAILASPHLCRGAPCVHPPA